MPRQPRTTASSSLAQQMAEQLFGGGQKRETKRVTITNATAQYLGKDLRGLSMYQVSFLVGGRRYTRVTAWNGERIAAPVLTATAREGGIGEPAVPVGGDNGMQRIKDNALAWLASNSTKLAATDVTALARAIRDWSGTDAQAFHRWWATTRVNLPALTGVAVEDFALDDDFLFGDLGGGGGGFAGPVYREPDRRVVEDFVKGSLVSLVGSIPQQYVDKFTDLFMKDHRRNFDSLDKEIDAQQSVVAAIRKTEEYKVIHNLRPKGVDERSWVADRKTEATRGGLGTGEVENFAITQATVGADIGDVAEAAAFAQLQGSGQAPAFLQGTFRNAVQSIFAGVGR